jgi:hypothetical protein
MKRKIYFYHYMRGGGGGGGMGGFVCQVMEVERERIGGWGGGVGGRGVHTESQRGKFREEDKEISKEGK